MCTVSNVRSSVSEDLFLFIQGMHNIVLHNIAIANLLWKLKILDVIQLGVVFKIYSDVYMHDHGFTISV